MIIKLLVNYEKCLVKSGYYFTDFKKKYSENVQKFTKTLLEILRKV